MDGEQFEEGRVLENGSGIADAIAAGMALTAVGDRIYKDEATGKTFYKNDCGRLEEVRGVRTGPCPLEEDEVTVYGVDQFVSYLATVDASRAAVFYHGGVFTAVLDYFDGPANGEGLKRKRVKLPLKFSPELKHWQRYNRNTLDQEDLANHMEDRLEDVVTPDGATMLGIVNTFQATTEVNFSRSQNLGNGQVQLVYSEEVDASAGDDKKMTVPESFELAVPIYETATGDDYEHELVRIKCRFRYRVRRHELTLTYIMDEVDKAVNEATEEVFKHVELATGLKVFSGVANS